MKAVSVLAGVTLALALLAGLLAGGYFLFKYLVGILGVLDPLIAALTVITPIVAILCAAIIASGLKSMTQGGRYPPNSFIDRAGLYQEVLGLVIKNLVHRLDSGASGTNTGLIELEYQLALHGSPKVIGAYVSLRRLVEDANSQPSEVSAGLSLLVKELRADLNRPSLVFREDDLLELLRQSSQ